MEGIIQAGEEEEGTGRTQTACDIYRNGHPDHAPVEYRDKQKIQKHIRHIGDQSQRQSGPGAPYTAQTADAALVQAKRGVRKNTAQKIET